MQLGTAYVIYSIASDDAETTAEASWIANMHSSETPTNNVVVPMFFPVFQSQIEIAEKIFALIPGWAEIPRALDIIATAFPSNRELSTVTAKVHLINDLYSTQLHFQGGAWAVQQAKRIVDIFECNTDIPAHHIVERMAGAKNSNLISFSSKYSHYFVSDDFPIYDSYARRVLNCHVHGRWLQSPPKMTYQTYKDYLLALKRDSAGQWSNRILDRYLWITGLAIAWETGSHPNREFEYVLGETTTAFTQLVEHLLEPFFQHNIVQKTNKGFGSLARIGQKV